MKVLILNGPNLNLLGKREPEIYGSEAYEALMAQVQQFVTGRGHTCDVFQTNHEGVLVDKIQAAEGVYDGIVINPAAYTHYSIAILDALRSVSVPAVEVHLSDISARESYRQVSVTKDGCIAQIMGRGVQGYLDAIVLLEEA